MTMDSLVLTLAVRWLEAPEALTARCVCRAWRVTLSSERDGGDLWKQVCMNTHPVATKEMKQCVDYRRFAQRLGRGMDPPPPKPSFTPTLRPVDVFAVVDLYRRHEEGAKRRNVIEASLSCPIKDVGSVGMSEDHDKVLMKGKNPYLVWESDCDEGRSWQTGLPLDGALDDVLGFASDKRDLRAKVTLFRRDTMESVCVMDRAWDDYFPSGALALGEAADVMFSGDSVPFATDEAGQKAQLMMFNRGFCGHSDVRVVSDVSFLPVLPPAGSASEPEWLAKVRQQGSDYHPTCEDRRALSRISTFEFEVQSLSFEFLVYGEGDSDSLDSMDDLMVALEGFCWK